MKRVMILCGHYSFYLLKCVKSRITYYDVEIFLEL